MGVPWRDAPTIGNLLGTRMVLNEFVAYSQLGPLKATLDPQVVHDRDVRALRLRQLQLDRHPDRRHRRAGAEPAPRSGAARPARDVRRHAGELHDRDDRGVPAVSGLGWPTTTQRRATRPSGCAAAASARARRRDRARLGPRRLRRHARATRSSMPYADMPHWPASTVIGHAGTAGRRHARGPARRGAGGPRALLRRPRPRRRSRSRRACSACSASRC